jgi:hypothetical protein
MQLLTNEYSPGVVNPDRVWGQVEASEIQVLEWPDRKRALTLEYQQKRGEQRFTISNPEPGQRIIMASPFAEAPRVTIASEAPLSRLLASIRCSLRILVYPENLLEPNKLEVQGMSLTAGTAVVVPTVTETTLGDFIAWRTGVLRVVGTVSADPTTIRFRHHSLSGGANVYKVGDSGDIPHRKLYYEYAVRDDAASFYPPVVHAGRTYRLTVEHSTAADLSYNCDIYIEPGHLV